jgi:two-component system, cell cycle response regulator DivK
MANELILVVEDNEKNRRLARYVLEAKGYRILEADSAEAGLAQLSSHSPDLILMDIQLPGMNGVQALARLRESDATRHIPVIAFTASVMPQDRNQIIAAGFDAFVAKPISLKEFIATIEATLRKDRP